MKRLLCLLLGLMMASASLTAAYAADDVSQNAEEAPVSDAPGEASPPQENMIPQITRITPANGGILIRFTAFDGAAAYRVFAKKADGSGWKGLGDTSDLSFTYTGAVPYRTDCYTVRALDDNGAFCSGYDAQGFAYTYLPPPALLSAECINGGIRLSWRPVDSAPGYRVYLKNADGWKLLGETASTSFTHTRVIYGRYTYTVQVYDREKGEALSFFDRGGITAQYIVPPRITACTPVQDGTLVTWKAVKGGVRYRLFCKNGSGWKAIGTTAGTSLTHTNPTPGEETVYTVRVTDANGNYISGYDPVGFASAYYAVPTPLSAQSVDGGVKISWDAVDGAKAYRVYVRNGSGWKGLGNTAATSFTDSNVISGSSYTYTVRAIDPDTGKLLSFFDRTGVSVRYVAAPVITGFTPAENGTAVTWGAVSGAQMYRLFYHNGTGWKTIGTTSGTSLTHTNPVDGKEYRYTVRATDANGNYISGFNAAGWTYRYIAPPAAVTVRKSQDGSVIEWEPVANAAAYCLYRKSFGGSWTAIARTQGTSFTDTAAPADTLCTYTLRTLDAEGQLSSYYLKDTLYYYNGALANGRLPAGGTTLVFSDGRIRQGYVTAGGKTYYYSASGTLMKNGVVGSESEGYRYADASGAIDMTARLAVTQDGVNWNVLDGVAYRVTTDKELTLHRALRLVSRLTLTTDTKAQKLRKCFDYLQTQTYECNPRVPHYRGMDWPIIYANDIFTTDGGNCFSYAAAFAFMAKAIGYTDVYACHSGGHGWTEIGGLVYDSEWQRSHPERNYFGVSYYTPMDVDYLGVKEKFPYNAWMHVAV